MNENRILTKRCEQCGASVNVNKTNEDGLFKCSNCGTKYREVVSGVSEIEKPQKTTGTRDKHILLFFALPGLVIGLVCIIGAIIIGELMLALVGGGIGFFFVVISLVLYYYGSSIG